MYQILNILILMVTGVVLANVLMEFGATNFFHKAMTPILRFSNLSGEAGISTILRTFSPSAGYSVLGEYYRKGRMGEREVLLVILLSTFPFNLTRLLRFYIPVLIPLLGVSLGSAFILIKMASAFLQSIFAMIYGRLYFEPREYKTEKIKESRSIKKAFKRSFFTLKTVIPAFIITILAVNLFVDYIGIDRVSSIAHPLTAKIGLPEESAIIIITQAVNLSAGYVAAGEFLRLGFLNETQALLTIVLGLIIAIPRIFFQYSFPIATSLFGFRMGMKLVIIKILAEILTLAIFLPLLF